MQYTLIINDNRQDGKINERYTTQRAQMTTAENNRKGRKGYHQH